MRTAIKRIFRGRNKSRKKKNGLGPKETSDDNTTFPDEVGHQNTPVSLFQPKQQGHLPWTPATHPSTDSSFSLTERRTSNERNSTTTSAIIAPIREEFDQHSIASERRRKMVTTEASSTKNPINHDAKEEEMRASPFVEDMVSANNYDSIPVLEQTKLPRGGVSVETQAAGRVQVRQSHFSSCNELSN